MMDLGSSLGIPSVSQGSIKRCIDKTKTRRQFLRCSKPLLQVVLSVFFTSCLLSHPFIGLHCFL